MTSGSPPPTLSVEAARSTELDLQRIGKTVQALHASCWYWGALSGKQAKTALRSQDVGTFLIRDSENCAFLFSLSVKTTRGTTSVRVQYVDGHFKLDSDVDSDTPEFTCVLRLIDYYRRDSLRGGGKHYWLEPTGRREVVVKLIKPLRHSVPSLQHSCRTLINLHTSENDIGQLPLPPALKRYLRDYPYSY
ncbi:cytokine-inducible SH2-containing protein-like [Branchiostoma lanceolatum]|uniref:cytokine-inducible SH2-containing protein-like n=1 Tax=Branchiostoma lanceolatum TaxID=7740 RepID=UPI003452B2E3